MDGSLDYLLTLLAPSSTEIRRRFVDLPAIYLPWGCYNYVHVYVYAELGHGDAQLLNPLWSMERASISLGYKLLDLEEKEEKVGVNRALEKEGSKEKRNEKESRRWKFLIVSSEDYFVRFPPFFINKLLRTKKKLGCFSSSVSSSSSSRRRWCCCRSKVKKEREREREREKIGETKKKKGKEKADRIKGIRRSK